MIPGETIISISSGGGGYGPPAARDARSVKHDLDEGWITRERAKEVYGVVLDDMGTVDEAATEALRGQIQTADSG